MPNVNVYNQEGNVTGQLELNPEHFGVKVKQGVVHSVVVGQAANARHSVANTKTKGEVRGGGKKPWKQKGTGRARQGSIRSPQWVGGGIVFGPRGERNFSVKINRKQKRAALFMVLSDKVAREKLVILESFNVPEPKTKYAAALFTKLPIAKKKALVVIPKSDPSLVRMVRNLQNFEVVTVNSLSVMDLLAYPTIVFWKDAIPVFETMYSKA
jgi:large subunit ribosomal protein L4